MDVNKIREARIKAEEAVSDMDEGLLKQKAFEVILTRLLHEADAPQANAATSNKRKPARQAATVRDTRSGTLPERILLLKDEGFFDPQRTLGEVKDELAVHGWHYPGTSLSGALQSLTQRRELRRLHVAEGKQQVWKYSKP